MHSVLAFLIFSLALNAAKASMKEHIREEITKSKHRIYVQNNGGGPAWQRNLRPDHHPHVPSNTESWVGGESRKSPVSQMYQSESTRDQSWNKEKKSKYEYDSDKDKERYGGSYRDSRRDRPWNEPKHRDNDGEEYEYENKWHGQNPTNSYDNYDKEGKKWKSYHQDKEGGEEYKPVDNSGYEYDYKGKDDGKNDYYANDHQKYYYGPSDDGKNVYYQQKDEKDSYHPNDDQRNRYKYYQYENNYKPGSSGSDETHGQNSPPVSSDEEAARVPAKESQADHKETYNNAGYTSPEYQEGKDKEGSSVRPAPEVQKIYILEGRDVVASGNHPSKTQGHYGLPTDMKWWQGWAQGWQTAVRAG